MPTTILVIEDEVDIREEIVDMLEFEDITTLAAKNGVEGLKLAQQHIPDLIVSDIMMPEMDGYQVFDALKKNSATANIPFIFLSALSSYEHIREGMNLGADDYLAKPFTYQQLVRAIQTRLKRQAEQEQQRLKQFASRVIQRQERDRVQFAEMLQTQILDPLNGLNLMLAMVPQQDDLHEDMQQIVRQIIGESGAISLQLHPTMLDHLGLVPALTWLAERFKVHHNLSVQIKQTNLPKTIAAPIKMTLYRIAEETLLNIVQHANVDHAQISVSVNDNILHMRIIDHGTGFNPAELQNHHTTGVPTLQERVALLDGEFELQSEEGLGTLVKVAFPLAAAEPAQGSGQTPDSTAPTPSSRTDQGVYAGTGVVLADDHDIFRQGLRHLIERERQYTVLQEFDSGADLLNALRRARPDVLVLDMVMPGMSSMDLLKSVHDLDEDLKILVLSPYPEEVYAIETLKHGATGYLLKDASTTEFMVALQSVTAGKRYVSEGLSEKLLDWYMHDDGSTTSSASVLDKLTDREREILMLVLEGDTSAQIAESLTISRRTVETHRSNLLRKLDIKNHNQLLKYALQHNLIRPQDRTPGR